MSAPLRFVTVLPPESATRAAPDGLPARLVLRTPSGLTREAPVTCADLLLMAERAIAIARRMDEDA